MKKQEFLAELKNNLVRLPSAEIEEILRDQEEYINDAMSAGKSEEMAVESLGDPREFAANLNAHARISKAEKSTTLNDKLKSTGSALFAVLALTPLNIIFILGPFFVSVVLILLGWVVVGALFVASLGALGIIISRILNMSFDLWPHLTAIFSILGIIGTGALGIMLMYWLSDLTIKFTISYLKWNVEFIKQRS